MGGGMVNGRRMSRLVVDRRGLRGLVVDRRWLCHLVVDRCRLCYLVVDRCRLCHLVMDRCRLCHLVVDRCRLRHLVMDRCRLPTLGMDRRCLRSLMMESRRLCSLMMHSCRVFPGTCHHRSSGVAVINRKMLGSVISSILLMGALSGCCLNAPALGSRLLSGSRSRGDSAGAVKADVINAVVDYGAINISVVNDRRIDSPDRGVIAKAVSFPTTTGKA
jgi:hypothetical protein